MNLYNVQSRKREPIDDPVKLQEAILSGSHSFEADSWVKAFDETGKLMEVHSADVQSAIQKGYRVATPTQVEVQKYVDENQGLSGAAKVFIGQALDEGLLGIPELIADNTLDPLDVAKKDALKNYHEAANALGGVAGFGASMLYGGPLFKGAAKGGEAVAKLGTHIADKLLLKSAGEVSKAEAQRIGMGLAERMLRSKTLEKGVQLGTEGALVSAPYAVTEAALGNPADAAETILAGVGIGSLFGVGGHLSGKFFKKAAKVTRADGLIQSIKDDLSTEGLQLKAGEKAIEALNPNQGHLEKLRFLEEVADEGYIASKGVIQDKDALGKLGHFLIKEGMFDGGLKKPDDMYRWLQGKLDEGAAAVAKKFDDIDAAYGSKVAVDPVEVAERLRGRLAEMRKTKAYAKVADAFEREIDAIGGSEEIPKNVLKILKEARKTEKHYPTFRNSEAPHRVQDWDKVEGFIRSAFSNKPIPPILLDVDRGGSILAGTHRAAANEILEKAGHSDRLISHVVIGELDRLNDDVASLLDASSRGSFEDIDEIWDGFLSKEYMPTREGWTLREANRQKAAYQQRVKEAGKLVDQAEPNLWSEISKEINRTIRDTIKRVDDGGGDDLLRDVMQAQERLGNFRAVEKMAAKNVVKDVANNDFGINSFITAGPAAVVGGMLGGGPWALLGAGAGFVGRELSRRYGDQLSALALNKMAGQEIAVDALKSAASRVDRMPEILAGLRSGVKRRTKASPVTPTTGALVGFLALSRNQDRRKAKLEYMEKINEKIAKLAASPVVLNKELEKYTTPLVNGGAPNIGKALNVKLQQATKYLQNAIPKPKNPKNPFAPKQAFVPSDREIKAFEDKLAVVQDPFLVLDELEAGTLNKNHMDALINVYPGIHAMIQRKVQETVADGVEPVPYAARMKLSLLLRAPMDETMTPRAIAYYQGSFAGAEAQEEGGEGTAGQAGGIQASVNVAGNAYSNAQNLMRG